MNQHIRKNSHLGLTADQVAESRRLHGSNVLTPAARESMWQQLANKFKDPLIIILLVAGVLSIGIACYDCFCLDQGSGVFFEPLGIFIAILLATGLAFYFERKAGKEFDLLNRVNDTEPVEVIRNGQPCAIPKSEVVVGDIVKLTTGQEVPADGKLLEAVALTIDESTLTGEPLCHKTVDPEHFDHEATFASNWAMRGTKVMEGHGLMEITAVGDNTEAGRVFESAQLDDHVKTPLSEQLDRLGILVARASYVIAALIILGRTVMYFTNMQFDWIGFIDYMLKTVMIAVTLIVVAVPEGLPMAVTLSLAYSMRRMLKANNLVRKLHACETMGATTVICTDKTGTLTRNRMQVGHADFFGHPDNEIIYCGIAANSTAEIDPEGNVLGNPTEGALLLWLKAQGADYADLRSKTTNLQELPFSTERKYMATVARMTSGREYLFVKGAPEIVMNLCSEWPEGVNRKEVDAQLTEYQSQAMRTLAFAACEVSHDESPIQDGQVVSRALRFLGIMAISDPVREDVPDAVDEVMKAGIKVKIVTGDTPATAREIGRQIGLWSKGDDENLSIVTGPEFEAMSDEEALRRCEEIKIIARARPMDKKRLVEILQKRGEVVAVTGDGTNDAPALKAAHVGLSMGDGTAVAKEASDITIIDNSFASIGQAVMWGRSLYRNIQRFIMFQLTVNVAACLIVLAGAFMGMQSPLTVTQMLWVNLIMDTFAAVALASLPPAREVMKEKPRNRRASIITPPMRRFILGCGGIFFVIMLGLLTGFDHTNLTNLVDLPTTPWLPTTTMNPHEVSIFFTVFVFLQFWNMFNARAFRSVNYSFNSSYGKGFSFIVAMIFVGQVLIVEVGGRFFNVVALSLTDWLIIILGTSAVMWIGELGRLFRKHA